MTAKYEWQRAIAEGEIPLIDVGPFKVARWAQTTSNDTRLPYDLHMVFDNAAGGRCVELQVLARPDGEGITGDGLRRLPIAKLQRQLLDVGSLPLAPRGEGTAGPLTKEERSAYLRARRREEAKGRRRLTDDDLRRVADIYRLALTGRLAPTAAVQRELRLSSRAQAGRWVAKAREAGFLGDSPGRGKKGEQR